MSDAGDDTRSVLFDEHSAAAPVAFLAPCQVHSNVFFVDGQSRRDTLNNYHQPLAVGLTCSGKAEH